MLVSLIDCISLWTLVFLLVAFKLEASCFSVARFSTIITNALIGSRRTIRNVSGRLVNVSKFHWDYVWVAIVTRVVSSLLVSLWSKIRIVASFLEKLFCFSRGGEVVGNGNHDPS